MSLASTHRTSTSSPTIERLGHATSSRRDPESYGERTLPITGSYGASTSRRASGGGLSGPGVPGVGEARSPPPPISPSYSARPASTSRPPRLPPVQTLRSQSPSATSPPEFDDPSSSPASLRLPPLHISHHRRRESQESERDDSYSRLSTRSSGPISPSSARSPPPSTSSILTTFPPPFTLEPPPVWQATSPTHISRPSSAAGVRSVGRRPHSSSGESEIS